MPSMGFSPVFTSAGGNRQPAAADWYDDCLAFGSQSYVALWSPVNGLHKGIQRLIPGHSDTVNVVRFFKFYHEDETYKIVVSGASDKSIKVNSVSATEHHLLHTLLGHEGPIRSLAVLDKTQQIISGSADASLRIWHVNLQRSSPATQLLQTLQLSPRMIPLAISAYAFESSNVQILAVAGTQKFISIYSTLDGSQSFIKQAQLPGHKDWIRALAIVAYRNDLLLASAGQDKQICVWKFQASKAVTGSPETSSSFMRSLSTPRHMIQTGQGTIIIQLQALFPAHEDWIYSLAWKQTGDKNKLLSTSADNSVSVWEKDDDSGLWLSTVRHGEMSTQKGATTATGSAGGFWIGLWCPKENLIACLDKSGSWRLWSHDESTGQWLQRVGISGHTRSITDCAWSRDSREIFTTSLDQTTRIFGTSTQQDRCLCWHETARPQIHGYDIQCLGIIDAHRFVSGSDEKLLRVFRRPLSHGANSSPGTLGSHPAHQAASMPVLGLSNAMVIQENTAATQSPAGGKDLEHIPTADVLASHTLWPEEEKLYGHGFEIAALAVSHNGLFIASSCRATSLPHAVIRVYKTTNWREVLPAISVHTLTCMALAFSLDDKFLLSAGRDRQWSISKLTMTDGPRYQLQVSSGKGHSRMISCVSWAPLEAGYVFATAGKDKACKIWAPADNTWNCVLSISMKHPITAVSFAPLLNPNLVIIIGNEDGDLNQTEISTSLTQVLNQHDISLGICPGAAVNRIAWQRPDAEHGESQCFAAANAKGVLTVFHS